MLQAFVQGNSDVGRVRTNNEDAFIAQKVWDEHHWLLVVIDGLGGYEGGEIAASIAKNAIMEYVSSHKGADCIDIIMDALVYANNDIYNQRLEHREYKDMGCVITSSILDLENSQICVAHVGDTRLYRFYEDKLIKLTHDHSFVGYLEDNLKITEEEAMSHPRRNLIDRIVGDEVRDRESPNFIEAAIFPISKGMSFLFCSDGLSDLLKSSHIETVLARECSLSSKVDRLIADANNEGGKDNVTVVIASIREDAKKVSITKKQITSHKKNKKKKIKKTIRKSEPVNADSIINRSSSNLAVVISLILILLLILIIVFIR